MSEERTDWREASTRALEAALERVAARLDGTEEAASGDVEGPHALAELVRRFGLTTFERDLLLLTAGCELDGRFGDLVARHHGDAAARAPTFSLALALLDDGHWSALAPGGVLRRARLLAFTAAGPLATRPLAIEETVLHYLAGRSELDERLTPHVLPVAAPAFLTTRQAQAAERLAALWMQSAPGRVPAVQVLGGDDATARAVAAAACGRVGLEPCVLELDGLPSDPAGREEILELWARDAVLGDLALVLPLHEPGDARLARRLVERLPGFVVVGGAHPLGHGARPVARLEVAPATPEEQLQVWMAALGPRAASFDGQLERLAQQFTLAPSSIREIAAEVAAESTGASGADAGTPADAGALWRAARRRARGGLDDLAQRLEPVAGWDDLVLPEPRMAVLRRIATHVRQRARVYEEWGFARHSPRGLGISALFAGASGTGKTMAAEVLAGDLGLDLYRIDLASIVSKYIGETEKNLGRLFDAAETSGAILLFDEADALFGKRSEVKDSHDRYANLEISYLLQRIETYRGLAILTTNLQRNLDEAFLRRLRFILQFPHPGPAERAAIWRRIFPAETPLAALDYDKLARLAVTGGHIKSIALHAAVSAANDDAPVAMRHLHDAARAEYAKLGKSLSDSEVKGWI